MIRQLQIEELSQLVPLFNQYMIFYGQGSNPSAYEAYIRERIERKEATVFMAYDDKSEAVGFVLNYHSFSSVSLGKILVLNDLYVSESARNQSIGQRLIERALEYAKEEGAVRVELGTAKTNIVAQGLYEKLGFVKDSEFYAYSYTLET